MKYDEKYVGIHSSVYGKQGSIVVCTMTLVGDDATVVRNISLCGTNEVNILR